MKNAQCFRKDDRLILIEKNTTTTKQKPEYKRDALIFLMNQITFIQNRERLQLISLYHIFRREYSYLPDRPSLVYYYCLKIDITIKWLAKRNAFVLEHR